MTFNTDELKSKVARLRELGAQVGARLEQSDDLEDFAEHFVYPLLSLDVNGSITWCNNTWCDDFGYSKNEALGMNITSLVEERDRCAACAFFDRNAIRSRHPLVLRFTHKNGLSSMYVTAINDRVAESGEVVGFRCILIRNELLNGAAEQLLRAGGHAS